MQVNKFYCTVIQGRWPKIYKYMIQKIQNVKKYIMSIAKWFR